MVCRTPYVCPDGVAVIPTEDNRPTMTGVENCADCDDGFGEVTQGALTICQPEFVCPNGTAVDGMTTEANVENCADCNSGFHPTEGENTTQLCRRLTLTNVDNEADTGTLELEGANSVTTAVIGRSTYLFVAGQTDDGVSVFRVGNDGALTSVANVDDSSSDVPKAPGVTSELELDSAFSVTTAVIGGTTYLFVAGQVDDGVSVFSVGSNGALTNVANVDDSDDVVPEGVDGTLELDGAQSVTTAVLGGTTYLFVAGVFDNGVSVFSVASDGTLTNVDNEADAGSLQLDAAISVTTAVIGSTTYLFVAGFVDNGVSVFSIGSAGTLTNVDNEADAGSLQLDAAISVTTAVVGSTTYLFVAGLLDDGVSVFSVASDGTLTNVDNEADNGSLKLNGATSVTTAVIGGTTYLFVAGFDDDGVSVFTVGSGGTLTNVVNVGDKSTKVPRAPGVTSELELNGAASVTTAVIGSATYLFVAGFDDSGVSVFRVDLVAE